MKNSIYYFRERKTALTFTKATDKGACSIVKINKKQNNMKTKILKAIGIMAILLGVTITANAQSVGDKFTYDGIKYEITSIAEGEETAKVKATSSGYSGDITIPAQATYDGINYSVTEISDWAFMNCDDLTSITLPNTVTTIGQQAFEMCENLTNVTIPNSVTSFGNAVFGNCESLTYIMSKIEGISSVTMGDNVFDGVPKSTCTLIIPKGTTAAYQAQAHWQGFNYQEMTGVGTQFEADGIKYEITSITEGEETVKVIRNETKPTGSITIPEQATYSGVNYSVTEIEEKAFRHCGELTTVTIPNSVTTIGYSAFRNCDRLTNVNIPASVTTIGEYSFVMCPVLVSINVDNDNTKYSSVEGVLFDKDQKTLIAYTAGKTSTEYVIPNGVTTIGVESFVNSSNLTSVIIPNSVTTIKQGAFYHCKGFTSITIPNSVTKIGEGVFHSCSNLTSITSKIENISNVTMGAYVFEEVNKSECTLTIPFGTTSDYQAIAQWQGFKEYKEMVEVGNQFEVAGLKYEVTSITEGEETVKVIRNETKPTGSITIPAQATYSGVNYNVTEIKNLAFYDSDELTDVTISASVTTIGDEAFHDCNVLTAINVDNNNTAYSSADGILFDHDKKTLVAYPEAKTGTEYTIPNSVTTIGNSAFNPCRNLTSITIPNSVTTIGNSAFERCEKLTGIIIPNSVETIGGSAFAYCNKLASITIPNTVTAIGQQAFEFCESLTSITSKIEDISSVTMGNFLFYEVNKPECTLSIPKGTTDAYKAIAQWQGFKEYTEKAFEGTVFEVDGIKYEITSIEDGEATVKVIDQEPKYTGNITIPEQVTFEGISYNVTEIAEEAFKDCDELTGIILPNTIITIGNSAFKGCTGLTSIIIPASVTTIGNSAFKDCTGLTSITLKMEDINNVTIGNNVFDGVNKTNCNITIPNGKTDDYQAITELQGFNEYTEKAFEGNEFEIDGIKYEVTSATEGEETVKVIKRSIYYSDKYKGEIVIPEQVTYQEVDYIVTEIGDEAFRSCTELTSITIPNSVETIGVSAFMGCIGLTSVTIPKLVTEIKTYAFIACEELTYITSKIEDISAVTMGNEVFNLIPKSECTVIVPKGKIEEYQAQEQWQGFNYEEEASVGDSFEADGIKYEITSMTEGETTLKVIANDPMYSDEITIPEQAVYQGTNYNVTEIAEEAFKNCEELTKVTIANTVTVIGKNAFDHCYQLTEVTISNGLITIGEEAFYGCYQLTSIAIPAGVTSIGKFAFDNCSGLASIDVDANNTVYSSSDGILFNKDKSTLIKYPSKKMDTEYTVPNSVTTISDRAFTGNKYLITVSIPNTVTTIGEQAFWDYFKLKTINVDEDNPAYSSLDGVLFNKDKTILITYPGGKQQIEYTVPKGVETICEGAFYHTNIGSVSMPNSVKTIGEIAFAVSGLSSISLSDSLTTIEGGAFIGCEFLTSITLPNTVTTIGIYAFLECKALTSVNIPNSVTSLGAGAFANCSSLSKVYAAKQNLEDLAIIKELRGEDKFARDEDEEEAEDDNIFVQTPDEVILYVPKGTKDAYADKFKNSNFGGSIEEVEVTLNTDVSSITYGETLQLGIESTNPAELSLAVSWSTDNDKITTVNNIGLVSTEGVGTSTITATVKYGYTATHELTVTPKTLTANLKNKVSKEYDGTNIATLEATNYAFAGLIEDDAVTLTATGTYSDKNAGENKTVTFPSLTLAGDDAGNYNFTTAELSGAIGTITPKAITVTADDKTKAEGEDDPTLTYTVEPQLIEGDEFTGELSRKEGETAGEYTINKGTLSAGDNYAITFVEGKLTITATTGIADNQKENINVYPTVVKQGLVVERKNISDKQTLEIYTVTGKLVKTATLTNNKQFVNLSDLQQGIYLLRVNNNIVKFIKQ